MCFPRLLGQYPVPYCPEVCSHKAGLSSEAVYLKCNLMGESLMHFQLTWPGIK